MTGPEERATDAALWRRWRQHAQPAPGPAAPDLLALAAYAEGRLDETQAEPVEDWLVENHQVLADLIAARATSHPAPPEAVIARAAALVEPAAAARIIPFRTNAAPRRPPWRMAMAWSGLAASLVATSLVGFALGNNAYLNLVAQPAAESSIHELLDPPSTLFVDEDEPAT